MDGRPNGLKVMLAMALAALAAPAGASAQGPVAVPAMPAAPAFGALPESGPLLTDLAARPTADRGMRVEMTLARPVPVLVAVRRLPAGTLMSRRYTGRPGVNRWTLAERMRPGRYSVRVIAVDPAGTRQAHRLAPVHLGRR